MKKTHVINNGGRYTVSSDGKRFLLLDHIRRLAESFTPAKAERAVSGLGIPLHTMQKQCCMDAADLYPIYARMALAKNDGNISKYISVYWNASKQVTEMVEEKITCRYSDGISLLRRRPELIRGPIRKCRSHAELVRVIRAIPELLAPLKTQYEKTVLDVDIGRAIWEIVGGKTPKKVTDRTDKSGPGRRVQ